MANPTLASVLRGMSISPLRRPDRIYPIPPHAPDTAPFDQGIFRRPVAPGAQQGLDFDNNGYSEDEWYRYVYPALVGRQRLDI